MKTNYSRRDFMKLLGLSPVAAMTLAPTLASAATIPHIVIVGGGFSGATCAKYLKMWGGSSIDVTIVETNPVYVSPILSNLVLNGQKTTQDLSFAYDKYSAKYRINMVHATVESIDKAAKKIALSNGQTLSYDKLVLAAGIDFLPVNSYDYTKIPHAWQSREGINTLRTQIESMQDGETFVMTIPKSPYRCPPGPYERACVVADYLKNIKNYASAKVIVLDENPGIIVEADTFGAVFAKYGVTYIPDATVTAVDDTAKRITYTRNGTTQELSGAVINVIPNQKAAPVVFAAGVTSGNWAPVNPLSYESVIAKDIHIIGDSQGTGQPKAGHIGNSEAKVCADAILRLLSGNALYPAPKTNSACYSPTSSSEASWLSAVYSYDPATQQMVLASKDAGAPSTTNYRKMFMWSGNLFADTFA